MATSKTAIKPCLPSTQPMNSRLIGSERPRWPTNNWVNTSPPLWMNSGAFRKNSPKCNHRAAGLSAATRVRSSGADRV